MIQNAGVLLPDPNWLMTEDSSLPPNSYNKQTAIEFASSDRHFEQKISQMDHLMKAWVGGSERPSNHVTAEYRRLLCGCDVLDLWDANLSDQSPAPIFRQDLGSLMDLNLIFSHYAKQTNITNLLEVGGGYGRLAEATFNIFGRSVCYVMADSVPASLYYAKKYLAHACPEARIGWYYDHPDSFNVADYDISIVPAWHLAKVKSPSYDVCVNIESMQEMNQDHVDFFLKLFDSSTTLDALIYLSNSHDYYFRGTFNYPATWQRVLCANTPRSWTPNHPTEIFRKTDRDCSLENQCSEAFHGYRVAQSKSLPSMMRNAIHMLRVRLKTSSHA